MNNMKRAIRKTVFWLGCKLMLALLLVALMRAANNQVNAIAQKNDLYFGILEDADRASREGRYDVALRQYRRACPLARENDLLAHHGIARTYERMGQTDRAIAEYRYILSHELPDGLPQTAWSHFQVGQLLFSQRKTAQARLEWQAAVAAAHADPYPQVGDLKMRRQAKQLLAQTSRTK